MMFERELEENSSFFLGLCTSEFAYRESKNKLHGGITNRTCLPALYPLFKIEMLNEGQMETQR